MRLVARGHKRTVIIGLADNTKALGHARDHSLEVEPRTHRNENVLVEVMLPHIPSRTVVFRGKYNLTEVCITCIPGSTDRLPHGVKRMHYTLTISEVMTSIQSYQR
jgi:hypothetical protein